MLKDLAHWPRLSLATSHETHAAISNSIRSLHRHERAELAGREVQGLGGRPFFETCVEPAILQSSSERDLGSLLCHLSTFTYPIDRQARAVLTELATDGDLE
jgi:hypothetical protein